jgi:predicted amidohydrolase
MKTIFLSIMIFTHLCFAAVEPIDEVFEPNPALYPTDSYAKVAVVAWVASDSAPLTTSENVAEEYKARNRNSLEKYIREAAQNGAELVITPEFGVVGYPDIPDLPSHEDNFQSPEQIRPYAERVDGKSFVFFSKISKELKIYIHYGFAEAADDGKYYNTVAVVDPQGQFVTSYRKSHLFSKEYLFLAEGNSITTYDSPFGKIGIVICSDIYGSFPMDEYAKSRLDILALSTSWAQYNTGWSYFTRGAKWVNAYVLASNQTYYPDSGVINPDGSAQSHIRQSEGVAYGYVPRK